MADEQLSIILVTVPSQDVAQQLARAGDQHDHTDRDRDGARQREAQRKGGHAAHGPHEEVPHAHERGQPTQAPLASPSRSFRLRQGSGGPP